MHPQTLMTRLVAAICTAEKCLASGQARSSCGSEVLISWHLQEVLPATPAASQAGDPAAAQLSAQLALLTNPKVQLLRWHHSCSLVGCRCVSQAL